MIRRPIHRVRPLSAFSVPTLVAAILVACGELVGFDAPELGATVANPLAGVVLHVDPDSPARRQAEAWRDDRPEDAQQLEKLASQPQADWFGDWNGDIRRDVESRVRAVRAAGGLPLLVAYNIPGRDCGSHSAGGAGNVERYRSWVRDFAAGLGRGPAVVILEPDALAAAECLREAGRAERFAMIRDAVAVLKERSGVRVYLDAGNPSWKSADEMARRLRAGGVEEADGFALNVSNTISTAENIRYGERLSAALGGAHFVIDTSRNGLGTPADREWCNPPGRALGASPTVQTGHGLVDAFLWIKRPGESDGTCNGGPAAGKWWPEYALGLAQRSGADT